MILFVHLLLGAAIGNLLAKNPILAIILAFLSHYLLDLIPHIEYPIKNIDNNQWKKALPDFIKVLFDIALGFLAIFLISKNQPIIYACAFFAILPDGISLLSKILKLNLLKKHNNFHGKTIHWHAEQKKISNFWRIFSQVAVAIICIYFLKF